jgi:hypothetical protein
VSDTSTADTSAGRVSRWPVSDGALDVIGVVALCGAAALSALLELMFIPLYAGSVVMPVVVVGAVVGNVLLPRLARVLVATTSAAVAPFATWLLVVVIVGLYPRPEGDVIVPGSGALVWVSYGVLLGGAVAGTVTVVMTTAPPRQALPAQRADGANRLSL